MKICSRCNNEVKKTDLFCPKCGCSLVKDEYGKRLDINSEKDKTNLSNCDCNKMNKKSFYSKPKNILGILFFVIGVYLVIMTFSTVLYMTNKKTSSNIEDSLADIDKLNNYLDDVTLIAKDYYIAWTSILEKENITLSEVSKKVSLDETEMTNDNCKDYTDSYSEKDLLNCIMKSHEIKGTYKKTDSDMIELYSYVDSFKKNNVRKVLVDIYGYAYELYYLPDSTADYNQYKSYYNNYINNIDRLLNSIKPDTN